MSDFPFYEVGAEAEKQIELGNTIHQKWTCSHCGVRQTMEVPNKFFTKGRCENCKKITNILIQGCNFLLIASLKKGVKP